MYEHSNVVLEAYETGLPLYELLWKFHSGPLPPNGVQRENYNISRTRVELTIKNLTGSINNGTYTLFASNCCNSISKSINISIIKQGML